jgi:hypothetical protein
VSPGWLLTQAERKPPSAGRAVGRRLLVCTNCDHVVGAELVAACVRQGEPDARLMTPQCDRFARQMLTPTPRHPWLLAATWRSG